MILHQYTEAAPRTREHEQLRDGAPDELELYDLWQVVVICSENIDGEPTGVTTTRLARVSTMPPPSAPRA